MALCGICSTSTSVNTWICQRVLSCMLVQRWWWNLKIQGSRYRNMESTACKIPRKSGTQRVQLKKFESPLGANESLRVGVHVGVQKGVLRLFKPLALHGLRTHLTWQGRCRCTRYGSLGVVCLTFCSCIQKPTEMQTSWLMFSGCYVWCRPSAVQVVSVTLEVRIYTWQRRIPPHRYLT